MRIGAVLTSQNCIVDLNEVTTIDKDGEQVLLMMIRDGAKLVATGLYTRHLLESLSAQISGRHDIEIDLDVAGKALKSAKGKWQVNLPILTTKHSKAMTPLPPGSGSNFGCPDVRRKYCFIKLFNIRTLVGARRGDLNPHDLIRVCGF